MGCAFSVSSSLGYVYGYATAKSTEPHDQHQASITMIIKKSQPSIQFLSSYKYVRVPAYQPVRLRNLLADEHTTPLGEWRRLRVSVVLLFSSRARSGKPLSGRSWSGKTHFGQGSSDSSEREGQS
ncbi:hypothetical protein PS1_027449 [Malus domestica]